MSNAGGSAVNFNRAAPVIDYTSLDWESIIADFKAYASATYTDRWTDFNNTQFAVVFLELLGYFMDMCTFYMNAGLREIPLATAQRRSHALVAARSYGYEMRAASPATTTITITSNAGLLPALLPATTTKFSAGGIVFQPDQDYTITTASQTIGAVEGEQFVTVALGTSTGAQNQTFTIPNAPVIDGTLVVFVSASAWTRVTTFTNSSPGDQVYRARADDEGKVSVIFGDSVNGKIPPISQAVTASYRIGGGVQGRVGIATIKSIVSAPAFVQSVSNPTPGSGGDDQETIEQARSAVPASLSAGDRAVTLQDYAALARQSSSSVAKASAVQVDSRSIRVVIAPAGGGAPSDVLKNSALAYLASRRQVGHRVIAGDPFYVPIIVNADLFVTKSARVSDIQIFAKSLFLTPNPTDQQNGILDFDNTGFGARDDAGDPQLTVSVVDAVLAKLKVRGMQVSRINQLTTIPQLKARGFVNSTDAALVWLPNALQSDELVRRRWRIKFTSPTAYGVTESIIGRSTGLTRSVLTDDRALFPDLTLVVTPLVLNPNTNSTSTVLINAAQSTGQAITASGLTDLYAFAVPGDPYSVEWTATPATGTVGTLYTPTKIGGDQHGFSWRITGTGFSSGDQYVIDVYKFVDDVLLDDDEIPALSSTNLTITIASAF